MGFGSGAVEGVGVEQRRVPWPYTLSSLRGVDRASFKDICIVETVLRPSMCLGFS